MPKSIGSILVVGFVAYFIFQSPNEASFMAGSFAEFTLEFLRRFGQFLTGLLEGANGSNQGQP